MALRLSDAIQAEIARQGEDGYPEEICGVMIGTDAGADRDVQEIRLLTNTMTENRQRRYLIDPLELARIERETDARGLTILGFYHTHPDHPAEPSVTDLDWAWPFYSYLIQSVRKGKAEVKRSWRLDDEGEKRFVEEEVTTR